MRPDLILIICHDLGDFLGTYGHPVKTPHLDRLAAEGVVFDSHFSTDTVCSPSRGSIMTGCYPHTHGLMGLVHRGWALDPARTPTLPLLLRAQGYKTCLAGIQHEHPDPAQLGYDAIIPDKDGYSENVTAKFIQWLETLPEAAAPIMASVGLWEPHRLGLNPSHFRRAAYPSADPASVRVPVWLPDIPEMRRDLADFYGAVSHMDACVGRVLDAVSRRKGRDTVILFTTDHGASFVHGKATLYDGGAKTSLLMRAPTLFTGGRRESNLTSHVDLLPTLLDLLGIARPAGIEGDGFAPLLSGAQACPRTHVFGERNYTNFFDPARMARTRRFKYIRKGLKTCVLDFQIPEVELSTTCFRTNRAVYDFYSKDRAVEELFDLEKDPGELRNVARDPVYLHALQEMRHALDLHMAETDDPFLSFRNELLMPTPYHQ